MTWEYTLHSTRLQAEVRTGGSSRLSTRSISRRLELPRPHGVPPHRDADIFRRERVENKHDGVGTMSLVGNKAAKHIAHHLAHH